MILLVLCLYSDDLFDIVATLLYPGSMEIEWDVEKAESNFKKHAVSFEEALSVLYSDSAVTFEDISGEEERFLSIGFSSRLRVLLVVYCYRDADVLRIISARKATKMERLDYEKGIRS